jgi:DNA-binding phage protein
MVYSQRPFCVTEVSTLSKVVSLRPGQEVPFLADYDYQAYLEDVRGAVRHAHFRKGMQTETIAAAAFVSRDTVEKFLYGHTREPRFKTVYNLGMVIGLPMPEALSPPEPQRLVALRA